MRPWWILVLAACGPAQPTPARPASSPISAWLPTVATHFAAADTDALRGFLHHSVDYGGIWFADAACRQEFLLPRTIPDAELDAFAGCLAGLHLAVSDRSHQILDFALFTYAPGLEIEARFIPAPHGAQLVWLGYDGSADGKATLPSVTPAAFTALRTEGDQAIVSGDDHVWAKVCIDRTGAVTGVHGLRASSQEALDAFTGSIATWKLSPFLLGSEAEPVCAWLERAGPRASDIEELPVAPLDPTAVVWYERPRVEGETTIVPSDEDKERLAAGADLVGTFRYCIDTDGHVKRASMYASTGLPSYDDTIIRTVHAWRFEPGPSKTCAATSIVYRQR